MDRPSRNKGQMTCGIVYSVFNSLHIFVRETCDIEDEPAQGAGSEKPKGLHPAEGGNVRHLFLCSFCMGFGLVVGYERMSAREFA